MSSECTSGQQAFAGAYVLLSCIFIVSVIHESSKLIYRYQHQYPTNYTVTPKYLLYISLLFVIICMVSLIKCILSGLVECDYITLQSFNLVAFQRFFADLYIIQLYILWLVLMLRLYFTFQHTPFELTKLTKQIYSVTFILLPFLLLLLISPSSYTFFIVTSFSLSIFMTLSILILFCYKLVQLNRYKDWRMTQQYKQYTKSHGLDLLTLITKHTVLMMIATLFSFAVLLILITIFVLNAYNVSIGGQQQVLDLCLLLDTYITSICVLFQFKFLHSKYLFCCNCLDHICKLYCNKYFSISMNVSQEIQLTTHMKQDKGNKQVYHPPNNTQRSPKHPYDGYDEYVLSQSISPMQKHLKSPQDRDRDGYRVASYDVESELGSIPDIPENETIDDILRRLHSRQNRMRTTTNKRYNTHLVQEPNIYRNISSQKLCAIMVKKGFQSDYTSRAVAVYEKHYGSKVYDVPIVEEIIYRLTVKDKLKELKAVQNLYQSRECVEDILRSLNFSRRYANLAILLYEVMAEMFEIGKYHDNIYDLELITELIMRLRAKFTEYGDLIEREETNNKTNKKNKNTIYLDCAEPEIEDTVKTASDLIVGHMPQITKSSIDPHMAIIDHRMHSMSPDGFIATKPPIINFNTASMDTGVSVPSSSGDEDEDLIQPRDDVDDVIIEVKYDTNMMMNDGEPGQIAQYKQRQSAIYEAESVEVDPHSNNNTLRSSGLDIIPSKWDSAEDCINAPNDKQYNVVIGVINNNNNKRRISEEEVITMQFDGEEDEEEEFEEESSDEEKDILDTLDSENGGVGARLSTIRSREAKYNRQRSSFQSRVDSLRITEHSAFSGTNMALKAVRIEQELIMSERRYLEGLYILYDEFIVPIFDNKLLDVKYKKQVTCNIPQIIAFHEQFYEELKKGNIPALFNKQSDYFKMYISYVTEYNKILDIFGKAKRNRKLHEFLEEKRLDEDKVLISYLILPIQRVPRYMLLLSELKKKTPKHHGFEYQDIENALQRIKLVCDEINDKQKEIENMSQCLLISNKLRGLNQSIVEPQRKYIHHFIFKEKKKKKNTQFFVFNDIVIVADSKWRVQRSVTLTKFEAKRPSKMRNKEVKIRILDDDIDNDITYITANDIPQKERHENISSIDVFCKTLAKHRTKLYSAMNSRSYNTTVINKTPTDDSIMSSITSSDDLQIFREEQEKQELAKWQNDASKGNKNKVLTMLKSPSEMSNSLTM